MKRTLPKVGSLVLLNLYLLISFTEAIIRNDITNRCLHLDSTEYRHAENPFSAYARTCSWDSSPNDKKTTKSDPNEWLEIVPIHAQHQFFIIRKIEESITCLSSVEAQPLASNSCLAAQSEFKIEHVVQTNFKGPITSASSFKIRNGNGQCLTVQPGTASLQFKECSPRAGLFQVWSVCRHTRQCDVDLTWTAREIKFPVNNTNATITNDMDAPTTIPTNNLDTQRKPPVEKSHVTVNEVLYSVHNALRIFDRSQDLIISTLSTFYPFNSLIEASSILQNVCRDNNLKCNACMETTTSSAEKITHWLIKWMSDCNIPPNVNVFASSDILQVPLHLFPISDSSNVHKKTAKSQKHGQEAKTATDLEKVQLVDSLSKENATEAVTNSFQVPSTTELPKSEKGVAQNMSKEQNWNASDLGDSNQQHDILDLIDVRIIHSRPSRKLNASDQVE
ncbi:Tetratricopeptide repeat protein 32 [Orchesella cincta]|uniref:Tetratricopeptide repeat protein 32 n=1 Tax=Orchesella cincta TaxID=48709 RepID=A0A1D2N7U6_ORCCI|nr:Tetratricopeptide repeat protein 32 [Orchesella cincta]